MDYLVNRVTLPFERVPGCELEIIFVNITKHNARLQRVNLLDNNIIHTLYQSVAR